MARVTVVGTGYVGLIQGVCLADVGHDVVCVDLDESKIERLSAGIATIYEDGLEPLIRSGLASGRLRFASPKDGWAELLGEIVFVAVGTPMAENGGANLSYVRAVADTIAAEATEPLTVVMKSTVPPGTGSALRDRHLSRAGVRIDYVSNPEFLREGHAIFDWYHTDRVVIGGDNRTALDAVAALYASLGTEIVVTDIASAETIKYASNAFLSTKISFINEIANLCDAVGADIDSVATGIGLDTRIGPAFLKAGIGYGGSCFPKDTRALDFISTINGYQFDLLKAVIDVNNRQRLLPLIQIGRSLPEMWRRKIAILGLSFKPMTDDVRESPALDIVPLLLEDGAQVTMYDPVAGPLAIDGAVRCDSVWDALEGASAAVLVTEWAEFIELDWARVASVMAEPRIIFDGRNALDSDAIEAAGLEYMGVGRAGSHRAS
ncbi:MAG: UDP-glucose/GDP-mannose dehydrogenase family protein [Coriobacteriia bacterium]|nr:UDP-glucose/GDP-mannose dehydrogenase family protein [Coriobacteriia bacterium]